MPKKFIKKKKHMERDQLNMEAFLGTKNKIPSLAIQKRHIIELYGQMVF